MDWQEQAVAGLGALTPERVPALELLFLDALAVHLMGPDRPAPPYTVEHGTVAAGHLLRAVTGSAMATLDVVPPPTPGIEAARAAIGAGARAFASEGRPGVTRLVNRFLGAAVGELEVHRDSADGQTRSLFTYGLLALASGPQNRVTPAAGDGVGEIFRGWDRLIGVGFVPPWRIVALG
ncbi:hypothetical protein [Cryptosporangium arvum]|uniref:hypothetical protein n=1 Tax=Cryptosporangium arvum TaxID=80871 RepID=UPI0004B97AC0|nr:hypothetical protein [Cryptosporangium arvum]